LYRILMEALNLVESFLLSAEHGSFSAAARQLGLTPAAVSKNVARLETVLGLRLFQRSTRSLALTAAGEQFMREVRAPFTAVQDAFAGATMQEGKPAGTLKVSVGLAFGREYLVPLLSEFLERYPAIVPDWHFDNRPVDLIAGGFDVAIGGGIELTPGIVARELAPTHVVVVASPSYMATREWPKHPSELSGFDGVARRSSTTGRLRAWTLKNRLGEQCQAQFNTRIIFDDPEAIAHAIMLGHGIAFLPMPHAARWLLDGSLVRLLPAWYAEQDALSIYYPNKKLLPLRTRAFVDYVVHAFRERRLAARFDAC
jgi:DNA-binding transcriptional LysR family regulator